MIDALAAAGFDLVHPFDARAASREPGLAMLADPSRRVGYLVGNTRALWPPFVAAVRASTALAASPHPLERYTEETITRVSDSAPHWFGHQQYDGAFMPLQRLAVATGLGSMSATHLVIHPTFGPWFALRAVILVAGEPPAPTQIARPCTCDAACAIAFDQALAASAPIAWLAVRDACPIGRTYRYSDEQIVYHYTNDRSVLVTDRGGDSPAG
jgi:methylmalonic aciduria homocystinuria type C protein